MAQPVYPAIGPPEEETPRPFWSVMIPTYNRAAYLERALRSVLEQADAAGHHFDEAQMQIEVVDNASLRPASGAESIEEIVRRVGGGRVGFFRQEENIGLVGNWNTCVRRARGQWVHLLHDDDIVLPGFYNRYSRFIAENPQVGMVFSRPILMDEEGAWKNIMLTPPALQEDGIWADGGFGMLTEHTSNFLRCPTIVIARDAYEAIGGYDPVSFYSTDWQLYFRVAAAFAVGYIHQPLALYREYSSSITYKLMRDRDLIPDIERNIRIGLALLPPERRPDAQRRLDEVCAQLAFLYRHHMHTQGFPRVELRYSRHMFRFKPTPRHLVLLLKSLARAMKSQARAGHKPSHRPSQSP